jgi:hypothetical protein
LKGSLKQKYLRLNMPEYRHSTLIVLTSLIIIFPKLKCISSIVKEKTTKSKYAQSKYAHMMYWSCRRIVNNQHNSTKYFIGTKYQR